MRSLIDLAGHPAIIFPAYVAALLPLIVFFALDFITEKWKTVGHTRRAGYMHLFTSIPPLCFLTFYIHLQRLREDYKEMALSVSAATFCIFHILRTLWGLVQLDAFKQWNKQALRCLNKMGYAAPLYKLVPKNRAGQGNARNSSRTRSRRERETWIGTAQKSFARVKNLALSPCNTHGDRYRESRVKKMNLSEADLEITVDKYMMVNSSLVDNAFASAELPCRLKKASLLKAIFATVTRGTLFRPSDFVECEMPVECSVRWLAVFVARFGAQWLTEKPHLGSLEKYDHLPVDEQKKVFRRRVAALAVLKTTFEEEGDLISERGPRSPFLNTPSNQEYLQLTESERAQLPYMCSGYESDEDLSLEKMSSSVREVILGWDRQALSILGTDQRKSVEQMSSSHISCFAKLMSSHLLETHLVPDWRGVTISEQIGDSDSKEQEPFSSLVPTNTSLYRQNLWKGRFENKFVDQACAHIDNWAALESGRRLKGIKSPDDISDALGEGGKDTFGGHKTVEMRAYEDDLSRDETLETRAAWGIVFLGSVMESVRAFLAHTVSRLSPAAIERIDWGPIMEKQICDMQCSKQLLNCICESRDDPGGAGKGGEEGPRAWNIETRVLWELQAYFHSAVSTQAEEDGGSGGLVKSHELMILCILGFPCLAVRKERHIITEAQETAHERDGETVLTLGEGGAATERAFFSVKPVQGPQPMWLMVAVDCATGTTQVELVFGKPEESSNVFDWQVWKDSFIGRLQGQAEWRERMMGPQELRPRKEAQESTLSTPIRNLSSTVNQWRGWPPHYVRMSMISRWGRFGPGENDYINVGEAMDKIARKNAAATSDS